MNEFYQQHYCLMFWIYCRADLHCDLLTLCVQTIRLPNSAAPISRDRVVDVAIFTPFPAEVKLRDEQV